MKMKMKMKRETYNDLGDDVGLAERFEKERKRAADYKNKDDLDDEKRKGDVEWVVTLPSSIR